ncbi:hypothetical protein [Zoogloea sp.]|uniref:hypothetical protein n=1 Tax=Zoogloea sp. TaxID=49181 RepID=UPI002609FDEE|nr:hypothetical protein [Zoogloea sp.]
MPTIDEQIAAAGRRILELSYPACQAARCDGGKNGEFYIQAERNEPEIAALVKFTRTKNPADLPPGFKVPAAVQPIQPPAAIEVNWK